MNLLYRSLSSVVFPMYAENKIIKSVVDVN